jgi:hypothetical protein
MTKAVDNTDSGKDKVTRIDDLNITLLGVENDLMGRALYRSRGELEKVYDFINKAAEDGIIGIDCDGCDDNVQTSIQSKDKEDNSE